ncbi:SH3 domain-containing protein [Streptomyces sp. NPDC001843]|uniref:SH3 domain-containing protein n=1 Tax=Streptomyces sp. NPDC001843 TaxID=3364617 RepID=UPI003694519E
MMIKRAVGRGLAGLVAAVCLLNVTPGAGHAEQADVTRPGGVAASAGVAGPSAAALSAAVAPSYYVVPYKDADVLSLPGKRGVHVATLTAGRPYPAWCWVVGETVVDHGFSSNIWIVFADGYVSALYFDGGEHGGLPPEARC